MFRIMFAAAAALVTFATPALAGERTFTHQGVTYVYTSTPSDDARIIEGTTSDGRRFRFTVRGTRVDGDFDGERVSFRTPKSADVKMAQR